MRLQVSNSADGSFSTVFSFHLTNASNATVIMADETESASGDQLDYRFARVMSEEATVSGGRKFHFAGFKSFGRFFRLYCDDNFGHNKVEV